MPDDEIKKAELRGYSKGYAAGKRGKKFAISSEAIRAKKNACWNRAFIAALPAAFNAEGWVRGGKPIKTLDDKMKLAAETADAAIKHMEWHI